jgi:DNA helicase-2/ATP-dependent DNA helicase PcrA
MVEGTFPAGHAGRPPRRSKGWLSDIGAVPFPLRGDGDGLPQWEFRAATTQAELETELNRFMDRCGAHEVAEERRLAYVACTRARETLLLTGAIWADGSTPREPSRFLAEIAELAEAPQLAAEADDRDADTATEPEISIGRWSEEPEEDAENPRAVEGRLGAWPIDPLGERRPAVESGAELVSAAMDALLHEYTTGQTTFDPPQLRQEVAWARELELLVAERDAGRSGELTVRLPMHLSASRAVALAEDPLALAERLRRPMPEQPSPASRRGSAFHTWLERRFGAAALVDVDELPGAGDDDLVLDDATLLRLQENFLASAWAARTAEAVEVAVETPVNGVVLRGRIDAVFARPDGGWDVVDWKTGHPPGADGARARAVQLAVYRLAWARLHRIDVASVGAAFFYALTGETVRPVDLLTEDGLVELLSLA